MNIINHNFGHRLSHIAQEHFQDSYIPYTKVGDIFKSSAESLVGYVCKWLNGNDEGTSYVEEDILENELTFDWEEIKFEIKALLKTDPLIKAALDTKAIRFLESQVLDRFDSAGFRVTNHRLQHGPCKGGYIISIKVISYIEISKMPNYE